MRRSSQRLANLFLSQRYSWYKRPANRRPSTSRVAAILTTTAATATAAIAAVSLMGQEDSNINVHGVVRSTVGQDRSVLARCEETPPDARTKKLVSASSTVSSNTTATTTLNSSVHDKSSSNSNTPVSSPSWLRRTAYRWGLIGSLPLPRRLHPHDPVLHVSRRLLRRRAADARTAGRLQVALARAVAAREEPQVVQRLVSYLYATLYGEGSTPQGRTDFLIRYGCTAWNDDILHLLTHEVGRARGYVEIGAGHGQWARALQTYRAQQQQSSSSSHYPLTFVRAYDNGSRLPLNPTVYHAKTQPHQAYFGKVLPCPDVASVLAQWENRQRILLLVYPPSDDDLAVDALRAYMAMGGDTLVYVGEGIGGANANDAFFDQLLGIGGADDDGGGNDGGGNDAWILTHVLPGVPYGTKGEEKVYVFQRDPMAK